MAKQKKSESQIENPKKSKKTESLENGKNSIIGQLLIKCSKSVGGEVIEQEFTPRQIELMKKVDGSLDGGWQIVVNGKSSKVAEVKMEELAKKETVEEEEEVLEEDGSEEEEVSVEEK